MNQGTTSLSRLMLSTAVLAAMSLNATSSHGQEPSAEEARAIAKEAYIYGFPMVDSYRIQHAYFVDTGNPEYKTTWNTIKNIPRVYTPEDKAVQTPNSDTPYSMVGMDLRAEPLVLTVPRIDENRYFSIQFVDAYTFNFHYVGSRTTGLPEWLSGRVGVIFATLFLTPQHRSDPTQSGGGASG